MSQMNQTASKKEDTLSELITACEPSLAMPRGGSIRTFEAEIDDHGPPLLRVRGVLSDHRCSLEHVWILRTPAYEVLEASARHLHGEPAVLAPELIPRYPKIHGVRLGAGFTRTVRGALGDLPGHREHLALAIEMARVGQQAYQVPQNHHERFAPLVSHMPPGSSRLARLAWEQDRAYMPSLCDSCYAYREATAALFDERDVVCFDLNILYPEPGQKRMFWRQKRMQISPLANGAGFHCQNEMDDTVHEIRVAFDIAADGTVQAAHSEGVRLPYHGICEDAQLRTPGLVGQKLGQDFMRRIADQVGGASGCAHLFDLSVDCLRFFNWSNQT
jgi:hypothetical protein